MGLFDLFAKSDINKGVEDFKNTPNAVLLDVRSKEEYKGGHIPGSKNLPLNNITGINNVVPDKNTPIYTYCLSGARSSRAASSLQSLGYKSVFNIGGISGYRGEITGGN